MSKGTETKEGVVESVDNQVQAEVFKSWQKSISYKKLKGTRVASVLRVRMYVYGVCVRMCVHT